MKAFPQFIEKNRESLKYLLLLVPLAISLFALAHHEWWRDEARPWLVACASGGIGELLENTRFIGHPHLYYFIVYTVRQLTGVPTALAALNLAFMIAALWLFMSAPFPLIVRFLFTLGFYPVYQYGVHTRNYSLLVFVLFLYVYLYVRKPRLEKSRLAVLALLAQVHLISLLATGVLFLFEIVERFRRKRPASAGILTLYLGVAASMVLSILQLIPGETDHVAVLGASPWYLWIGIATGFAPALYGPGHAAWQMWIGGILFCLGWSMFWGRWTDLLRYLLLVLSLILLFSIVYLGFRWHFGFYMIFLVVCLWMSASEKPFRPYVNIYLAVLFLFHAGFMIRAVKEDVERPYSNGPAVARTILGEHLENLPLLGVVYDGRDVVGDMKYSWEVDRVQPAVVDIPGKDILDPLADKTVPSWGHYGDWNYFKPMNEKMLEGSLQGIRSAAGTDLLVVFVRSFPGEGREEFLTPPPFLETVAAFPKPLDFGEEMVLCRYPKRP